VRAQVVLAALDQRVERLVDRVRLAEQFAKRLRSPGEFVRRSGKEIRLHPVRERVDRGQGRGVRIRELLLERRIRRLRRGAR
jgi:hypothetical protein